MADPAPAITDNPTVGTPAPTEGPMIVTPNPLTNTTPPPGNNGAPAARLPTPPLPKNYSLQDIFINILFVVLCGFGIYYGWVMGQEYGRSYLIYIQSFGPWIRSWITSRHIELMK